MATCPVCHEPDGTLLSDKADGSVLVDRNCRCPQTIVRAAIKALFVGGVSPDLVPSAEAREREKPQATGHAKPNGFDVNASLLCQPFDLRPEEQIPPRRWLYPPWCVRGFVSLLHGHGGAGKT